MKSDFRIIGFDADDTLWVNELYYKETENEFCRLFSGQLEEEKVSEELFKTEMQNLELYGYGAKAFMLSLIETGLRISAKSHFNIEIEKIINLGKGMLNKPVVLLDGVIPVLENLSRAGYKMVVATKGDLLDQERKLRKSGIEKYFHHIEIMSDKNEASYGKLLSHLDINPEDFLMVGNSLKSDILPVLNLGGYGIFVPYHLMWAHEHAEVPAERERFSMIGKFSDLPDLLGI